MNWKERLILSYASEYYYTEKLKKLSAILDRTVEPTASQILRNITLRYQNKDYVSLKDIYERELALLASKGSNIIRAIIKEQSNFLLKTLQNEYYYSENIQAYDEFISLTAELVKDLSIPDNPISASRVISKLISRGILSKDALFTDKLEDNYPNIIGFLGIDIINGEGCCRHLTGIHKNIFDKLGLYDVELPVLCSGRNSFNHFLSTMPNHIINLILFNEKYYTHDLSLKRFGYLENGFTITGFHQFDNKRDYKCYYKPSTDMVRNNLDQQEVIDRIVEFDLDSEKPPMDERELNEILIITDQKYYRNYSLLSDFQHEKEKYIQKIIPTNIKN